MKQILVENNELLIFEDIRDLHRKQEQADKQDVDIFFLDSPPRTVNHLPPAKRVV